MSDRFRTAYGWALFASWLTGQPLILGVVAVVGLVLYAGLLAFDRA